MTNNKNKLNIFTNNQNLMLMKDKFFKFINLQGKYLTSLLILLAMSIGNVWGATPDYESYDWDSDAADAVIGTHGSVTIGGNFGTKGNVSGHYYLPLDGNLKSSDNPWVKYLSVTSSIKIDSIEIFYCPNGSNQTTVAWAAWGSGVTPNQKTLGHGVTTGTKSSKAWTNAVWEKIDLSAIAAYTVYLSRSIREFQELDGTSISNFGGGQTINVLGIRVWLHKYTVTLNPDGGAYASTPTGWTLSEGKYSTSVLPGSLSIPAGLEKGGNTFNGWKNKNNETVSSTFTVSKDTVLTAQWTASGATQSAINYVDPYNATPVSTLPATYYEGTGVASFPALNDVADHHFTGWSPASIGTGATGAQTVTAQWVDAYDVTFALGTGASGTAPAGFQKWEGAKFNLSGQGDMVAPSGKVFDGWKAGGTKYAAGAEYTMGNAAVEFVAQWKNAPQTIFDWTAATTNNIEADNTDLSNATYGTLTTGTSVAGRMFGTNTMAKNGSGYKLANNDVCIEIEGTVAFAEGDTVVITGKNGGSGDRCFSVAPSTTTDAVADTVLTNTIGSQTDNSIYKVVIKSAQAGAKLRVFRKAGSTMYLKAIKVIRPAAREIASTVITLSDVKVNGRSISSDSLAILKTASAYELTLKDAFASAPEIKFNEHTVITYADGESPATKETDKVYTVTATEVSSQWQAQQTIDGITYTVKAPKVSSATVTYYDGATKLGEEVVAVGGYATASEITTTREHYAFDGWYNDAGLSDGPVTLASTVINADKDFYGSWTENAKAAVTFQVDGAQYGDVQNVYVGDKVASVDSPTKAGNVFRGWYNGESKFDFTAAIASGTAITLDAKWAAADANHYVYAYNDDFHYDGVVYKTPEGTVDEGSGTSNIAMTTPYTLFAGAEGITSIVMTDGIYDSKTGAIQAVTALMKVNNNATSKLTVTIKSGYTATLKIKASGYSATRTISVSDATPASGTTTGQAVTSGAMSVSGIGELSFAINSGSHDLTVTGGTLYIAELDIEATALPAHTVTYMPGEGSGAEFIIDDDATEVSDGSTMFTAPEGKIFHGWKDALNNDVAVGTIVEADMTLTAQWIGHYAVTFNMQGHGAAIAAQDIEEGSKAVKPADPSEIGYDFGGWFTDAECTAGNEFDFNTAITVATPLYAKWTEFGGCTLLYPATSGAALNVGDNIDLQSGSKGGSIQVVSMKTAESSIAYDARGLLMGGGSADIISVTLNNDMDIDTKISVTLDAKAGSRARGLYLLNGTGGSVKGGTLLGWDTPGDDVAEGEIETFSYTVEDADGLAGTNVFRLKRQNSTYIKCIKVESCGAAVVYHNLTSAILPDNDPAYATVTLGASSVREGLTTTAEYSAIDPAYEFVSWSVSGAGASIDNATANPVTVTMGTADAVITLNLQLIPEKYTVNYYDGSTPMGTEDVELNANPTAAGITTAKRHYTFQGWAETDGGSVVALNTITSDVIATISLYAVYAPVACPTSGYLFSMESDEAKKPAETVVAAKDGGKVELADYATISGGNAFIQNDETSNKDAISTSGQFLLKATKEYMKIELNCVLQEGDIIRIPDNSAKCVISTSDAKTGTYGTLADKNAHEFVATAAWANVDDIYILYDGSSLSFTQIEVYRRPALTGASLADLTIRQGVIKTPELTLEPSADAIVTSQAWEIVGTPDNLTGAAIDPATGAITTGTLDDASLNGTIIVKVTLNGSIEATCTATVVDAVVQQNVTKSTIWNWQNTGATADIKLDANTDPKKNETFVLANVAVNNNADFESDKLVVEGEYMVRDYDKTNPYFQGQTIKFYATVAGVVRVKFSNTGGNPARELYINGVGTGNTSASGTLAWSDYVEVPVGEVSITAYLADKSEDASQKYIRVAEIEFFALDKVRDDSWIAPGELGTVCYPNGHVVVGAEMYQMAGVDENRKFVFDEVTVTKPGVPYLFRATSSNPIKFFKTTAATVDEAGESHGMVGTFIDKVIAKETPNVYYFSGTKFYAVNKRQTDLTVPANRAYIDLNEPHQAAPARDGVRRLIFDAQGYNTPTDMKNVQNDENNIQKILINGELFILRGEKMYDATGRLVK